MSRRFHVDPNERVDVFEFDPNEVISDAPPNVVTIRARMTEDIYGRVQSALITLGVDNKPETHVGAHVGALLLHNILAWRGPDFDDLPCTPENIRALPSAQSDPFIAKVADEIVQRNKPREGPSPKSAAPNISASAGAVGSNAAASQESVSLQLATGTPISPLRSAITGHRSRSDD